MGKDIILALCGPNPRNLVYQEISARHLSIIYIYIPIFKS